MSKYQRAMSLCISNEYYINFRIPEEIKVPDFLINTEKDDPKYWLRIEYNRTIMTERIVLLIGAYVVLSKFPNFF